MRTTKYLLTFLLLPLAMVTTSCGGGTTGTSSIAPLTLNGYAEQADGSRGAGLSMSVKSGTDSTTILTSGTDQNGDFSMELPANEETFVIEVDGIGSTQISRRQSGEGNISTKLTIDPDRGLITKDLFEAQLALDSAPCSALEIENNQINVVAPITEESCEIKINTDSEELSTANFIGTLMGSCPKQGYRNLAQNSANSEGAIRLDLAPAIKRGCVNLSLRITHRSSTDLESRFPIEFRD